MTISVWELTWKMTELAGQRGFQLCLRKNSKIEGTVSHTSVIKKIKRISPGKEEISNQENERVIDRERPECSLWMNKGWSKMSRQSIARAGPVVAP